MWCNIQFHSKLVLSWVLLTYWISRLYRDRPFRTRKVLCFVEKVFWLLFQPSPGDRWERGRNRTLCGGQAQEKEAFEFTNETCAIHPLVCLIRTIERAQSSPNRRKKRWRMGRRRCGTGEGTTAFDRMNQHLWIVSLFVGYQDFFFRELKQRDHSYTNDGDSTIVLIVFVLGWEWEVRKINTYTNEAEAKEAVEALQVHLRARWTPGYKRLHSLVTV